jgi:hypothetical protein
VLLRPGDDPAIEPGQLMVRVFLPPPGEGEDYDQALAAWQDAYQAGMSTLRRELSLRLPAARLLEFTFDDADAATPRILMTDDGSQAAEQLSGREIVTTALALLRANYVFPELADRAATAVEARLAAGEYDDLDEITLTELVTSHLREVCEDKHLALRLGGGPARGRADPADLDPDLDPDRDLADPDPADRDPGAAAAGVLPGPTRMGLRIMRPGGWPCGRWNGWTTSASTASSG